MSARTNSSGPLRAVRWANSPVGLSLARLDGNASALRHGLRTVLIGDSMTDWYHSGNGVSLSSALYDSGSGILTLTYSGAHLLAENSIVRIWHYSYTSMRDHVAVPIVLTSSTVVTANIGAGLAGVPATDIKTGLYVASENHRSIASFVNWIQMVMGWPLTIVRNAAQSGDLVAGNVRRLARDVAALSPDLVIGQSPGINDMRSGDARSEVQITSDLTELYEGVLATGAILIVGTLTPVSSAETDRAHRSNMQMVLRINDWIREFASAHAGMHVIDHYASFIDISNTTGLALSSRVRNDGIHPATKSSILVAKKWVALLQHRISSTHSTLSKSIIDCHPNSRLTISSASASGGVVTINSTAHTYRVGDEFRALGGSQAAANGWFTVASVPGSGSFTYSAPGVPDGAITGLAISRSRRLFTNPLLQTTTGGNVNTGGGNTITGVAAANVNVSNGIGSGCTAVASVAAAANVAASALGGSTLPPPLGNEQVMTISAAAAGNRPGIATYGSTAFATQMYGGRSYIAECVLRLSSTDWTATMISNLLAVLSVSASPTSFSANMAFGQDASETYVIAEDMRLHLRSAVIRLPTGCSVSSADLTVQATIQAAFSSGPVLTMGVSQINVIDVTGSEDMYS